MAADSPSARPPPPICPPGQPVPRLSPSCPGFFRYASCVRSAALGRRRAFSGPPGIAMANGLAPGRVPGPARLALGCCAWGHLRTAPSTCPRTSRCSPRGPTRPTSAAPSRYPRRSAPPCASWPARSGPGPPSRSAPAAEAPASGCSAACARARRSPASTPNPNTSGWPGRRSPRRVSRRTRPAHPRPRARRAPPALRRRLRHGVLRRGPARLPGLPVRGAAPAADRRDRGLQQRPAGRCVPGTGDDDQDDV